MTEKRPRGRPPGRRPVVTATVDPEVNAALNQLAGDKSANVNRLLRAALNITA